MRTRSIIPILAALCLSVTVAFPPAPAAGKKSEPQVVGTDDAGDWGANVDPTVAPIGDILGQDLVEAAIGMADKKTVNFIIKVNALPPSGGVPETSRYTWDFIVGGEAFQLSGAFTEYLRGVCNPLHTDSCPPPQDPGEAPFFLRQGPCNVGADCHVVALTHATFDAAESTITIPLLLEVLKAKPGSKIDPGVSSFGGTIYAAPAVLVSNTSLPHDTMIVTDRFVVPKGKKKKG